MILRSLTKHVKDQNWFAVGIDFLIVVVGVFIGIQVANWNEDRKDRTLEQIYLERLLADVEASIERNIVNRSFVQDHVEKSELVLKALMACDLPTERRGEFATGLFHIGKLVPVTYVLGTVNEIHSAGKSSIFRNADMRNLLNGLVDEANYQTALFPVVNASTEQELAYVYQHVIFLTEANQDVDGPITWHDIKIDFPAMCGNTRLQAAVSTIKTRGYENIDWLERAITKLEATKATLDQAILVTPHKREAGQ